MTEVVLDEELDFLLFSPSGEDDFYSAECSFEVFFFFFFFLLPDLVVLVILVIPEALDLFRECPSSRDD